MASTQISKRFKLVNKGRLDDWYGPYDSLYLANSTVPVSIRLGKIIGLNTSEGIIDYYWKLTTADISLVKYVDANSTVFEYRGVYNATTNTPALLDSTGQNGWLYDVTVGGTQNFGSGSITVVSGDQLRHDGIKWNKIENFEQAPSSDEEFLTL